MAGLDLLGFPRSEEKSLHLEDAQCTNVRSVNSGLEYVDICDKEREKTGQNIEVPSRRANYKPRADRVAKLRAEDEIAALLRNRYLKDRWRVHAQD